VTGADARYRPVVFIGSSTEDLETALAIGTILDHECQVKPWTSLGSPSSYFLSELIEKVRTADFAVLVVDAVDVTQSRSSEKATPRDNVVFELGLCQGVIGMDRCFVVYDRTRPPDLPSDLFGLTPAKYQRHVDGNQLDALQAPVHRILASMKRLGPRAKSRSAPTSASPTFDGPCIIIDRWSGLALDSQREPHGRYQPCPVDAARSTTAAVADDRTRWRQGDDRERALRLSADDRQ